MTNAYLKQLYTQAGAGNEQAIRELQSLAPRGRNTSPYIPLTAPANTALGAQPSYVNRANYTQPTVSTKNSVSADQYGLPVTKQVEVAHEGYYVGPGAERPTSNARATGLDRARTPLPAPSGTIDYNAGRNPAPDDSTRAQQPFVDPKLQLQKDRLELNRQQFEQQKQRYADQQAAAAARMQAQQNQSGRGRPAAPPLSSQRGDGGGGGGNPAMNSNMKDGIKTPPQQKPAAGRGGGGGGRGGGGGGLSPEQKARNKAREGRQMEREKDRDRAMADYNNTTEQRARKAKTASDYYSIRDSDKPAPRNNTAATGAKGKTGGKNNSPGGDPSYGPGTGGSNDTAGDAAAAAAMYNHLNSAGGGRKMVQAYGNKHSKVWVKARGDFA